MIDLSDPLERYKLAQLIAADVERYSCELYPAEHRKHLGASLIGDPCAAKAWNGFRWLKLEQHSGQMRRLFNRGHLEESRFVELLRGIGFDIREFAREPEHEHDKGEQFRISGVDGHFGGSLDGMMKAPARYAIPDDIIILDEFKTHNEKSFTKLAGSVDKATGKRKFVTGQNGVRIAKPQHYAQMCSYGRAYSFRYALYCAVNKNTDELFFEIVLLDWTLADDLFRKAEDVIRSQTQPAKIAQVETYFECKYCHFSGICFRGEMPEKNCRSCKFAVPVACGQWQCCNSQRQLTEPNPNNPPLTPELIATGCDAWEPIING